MKEYTEQIASQKPQKRRRKARTCIDTLGERQENYGLQEHYMTDIMDAYTEWKNERDFAYGEY